jgi:phosphatidylserine/phosphatidylglycerophosphate/cardiolipin synthase-like enzyme
LGQKTSTSGVARSLWLNFQMTLIIYDKPTAQQLARIVDEYHQLAKAQQFFALF